MLPAWSTIRAGFHAGELLAYPTEAVWGLGCDPWNQEAVWRLLALKRRPVHKGLILVAGNWATMNPLIHHLSADQRTVLIQSWPGAVTWLIPTPPHVPWWITGGRDTVAVRLSAHPLIRQFSERVGLPLVSTSANRSGGRPARHEFQVRHWFGRQVPIILGGALGGARQPSTIRDLRSGQTLR